MTVPVEVCGVGGPRATAPFHCHLRTCRTGFSSVGSGDTGIGVRMARRET